MKQNKVKSSSLFWAPHRSGDRNLASCYPPSNCICISIPNYLVYYLFPPYIVPSHPKKWLHSRDLLHLGQIFLPSIFKLPCCITWFVSSLPMYPFLWVSPHILSSSRRTMTVKCFLSGYIPYSVFKNLQNISLTDLLDCLTPSVFRFTPLFLLS